MGNAITFRMNQGVPGGVTRQSQAQIEAQILGATAIPGYGQPVKLTAGLAVPLALVGDTQAYGWLVRPFPTQGPNASDPLGTSVPPTTAGTILNILVKGYITVFCQANPGSIVAGGTVYLRYANPSGQAIVGGVEATAIGATTVAMLNARFTGNVDAAGNAEIYVDNP